MPLSVSRSLQIRQVAFMILVLIDDSYCKSSGNGYNYYRVYAEEPPSPEICTTATCNSTAAIIKDYMDTSIDPCDDFYQFACGNFVKNSFLVNGSSINNSISRIQIALYKNLITALTKKLDSKDPDALVKLKTYFDACLNKDKKQNNNTAVIANIFHLIGGWPVMLGDSWNGLSFNWLRAVHKLRNKGFLSDFFFELTVRNNILVGRKEIHLSHPSFHVASEPGYHTKVRQAYFRSMIAVTGLFNISETKTTQDMLEVLNFETSLAKNCLTAVERSDLKNYPKHVSISELQKKVPITSWLSYVNRIFAPYKSFKPNDTIVVDDPKYIYSLGRIMAGTPKRVLANYICWRVILQSMDHLSKPFQNAFDDLNADRPVDIREKRDGSLVCASQASSRFPLAMGALYVRRYFSRSKKRKIEELFHEMRTTFKEALHQVRWMDERTRKEASDKLDNMASLLAYPEELTVDSKLDDFYRNLSVYPTNHLQNELNLNRFYFNLTLQSYNAPDDLLHWTGLIGAAATTRALYSRANNAIIINAGMLQDPYFNEDNPNYVNFGGIGSVVGHEMIHGFDNVGRFFDKENNIRYWWSPVTLLNFFSKARCLVSQYNNFTEKHVGLNINGWNTLSENIADNGGIKIAYSAYDKWRRLNNEEPRLPGLEAYSPKQMFWISNAHAWCTRYGQRNLANLMLTEHAPAAARVIGSFANRIEFAVDFRCFVGSKMNPESKCSFW